jgi:hypothetical protein
MNMRRYVLTGGLALAFAPLSSHALEVGIEVNMLKPANQDVVLGTDYSTSGANDVLEPDSDVGFKLFVQDATWRASWLKIDSKTSTVGGPRESVSLDHPDSNYGSYTTLAASGEIQLDEIGADYLIPLTSSGATQVTMTTGLRYVMFESDLYANYDTGGQVINRKASNDLFGFRAGVEASRNVGVVTIDATFGLGLMFGKSKFSQTETSSGYVRDLSSNSMAPTVDAQVRVTYKVARAANLWLGYELMQFTNVATQQIFVDDVNDASQIPTGIDAGFHGVKAGFSWIF